MLKSPITGLANVEFLNEISCDFIIDAYHKNFSMDVGKYFRGIKSIKVYKCLDTQYSFFSPFHLSGDGNFYKSLQRFDWYYMDWKWEHQNACQYLSNGMRVLEFGCAQGAFIERIQKNYQVSGTGVELNSEAAKIAISKGLDVKLQNIIDYSNENPDLFDLVCSFQVMEHIYDIKPILEAQIRCLKKGGNLIISVPNNESFLGQSTNILNMPPHHMGLWSDTSLSKLQEYFPLKLKKIHLEPLQSYHYSYFHDTVSNILNNKFQTHPIIHQLLKPVYRMFFSKRFKAFTIQAVFEKV